MSDELTAGGLERLEELREFGPLSDYLELLERHGPALLAAAREREQLRSIIAGEESDKDAALACLMYAAGSFQTIHKSHVQNMLSRMERFKKERDRLTKRCEGLEDLLADCGSWLRLIEHRGYGRHDSMTDDDNRNLQERIRTSLANGREQEGA